MRCPIAVAAAVLLLLVTSIFSVAVEAAPGLIELTNDRFFMDVCDHDRAKRFSMVFWFTPWCTSCTAMLKEYGEVANHFSQLEFYKEKVTVCKVNAAKEEMRDTAHREGVRDVFPTLRLHGPGVKKPFEFTGDRDQETMIKWIQGKVDEFYVQKDADGDAELYEGLREEAAMKDLKNRETLEKKSGKKKVNKKRRKK